MQNRNAKSKQEIEMQNRNKKSKCKIETRNRNAKSKCKIEVKNRNAKSKCNSKREIEMQNRDAQNVQNTYNVQESVKHRTLFVTVRERRKCLSRSYFFNIRLRYNIRINLHKRACFAN
jgi:hypothetical protein